MTVKKLSTALSKANAIILNDRIFNDFTYDDNRLLIGIWEFNKQNIDEAQKNTDETWTIYSEATAVKIGCYKLTKI